MKVSRSARFEIFRRLLAAVADELVFDHLTLVERGQARALDRGDMDEYVFAAVLRLNEPITFRRVEPFHCAGSHHGLLCLHEPSRPHDHRAIAYPKSALPKEGTPEGARQNKAKLERRECMRFPQRVQPRGSVKTLSSARPRESGDP